MWYDWVQRHWYCINIVYLYLQFEISLKRSGDTHYCCIMSDLLKHMNVYVILQKHLSIPIIQCLQPSSNENIFHYRSTYHHYKVLWILYFHTQKQHYSYNQSSVLYHILFKSLGIPRLRHIDLLDWTVIINIQKYDNLFKKITNFSLTFSKI